LEWQTFSQMSSVSCFHIAIYPMRQRVSISTSSGVVARMTETVPETTTFYASFFGTTDFSAGAFLGATAFFADATVFLLCSTAFLSAGFCAIAAFLEDCPTGSLCRRNPRFAFRAHGGSYFLCRR
jgi:hypothetical protein